MGGTIGTPLGGYGGVANPHMTQALLNASYTSGAHQSIRGKIEMLELVLLDMDNVVSGLKDTLLRLYPDSAVYTQIEGIMMDMQEVESELIELNEVLEGA